MELRPERRSPRLHWTGCRHYSRWQDRCPLRLSQSQVCIAYAYGQHGRAKCARSACSAFAITIMVVGIAAWSASTHSAVKAELPQIDPLSLEANAKNLPTQEELNF